MAGTARGLCICRQRERGRGTRIIPNPQNVSREIMIMAIPSMVSGGFLCGKESWGLSIHHEGRGMERAALLPTYLDATTHLKNKPPYHSKKRKKKWDTVFPFINPWWSGGDIHDDDDDNDDEMPRINSGIH